MRELKLIEVLTENKGFASVEWLDEQNLDEGNEYENDSFNQTSTDFVIDNTPIPLNTNVIHDKELDAYKLTLNNQKIWLRFWHDRF